jgi:hypothetical protein
MSKEKIEKLHLSDVIDSELFELSFKNYTDVAPLIEDNIISEYNDFVNRCNIDIEFRKKWLGITIK